MDADSAYQEVAPKSLRLLGRDGMNLLEFPITLLTDRVPKSQSVAVYQDSIFDERSGLTLTRKLTISAGSSVNGLTTAADDDVILALIQITKEQNDFTSPKVFFSRHQLCKKLGWVVGGASYDRLEKSLDKWMNVTLKYENAWRDNRTKKWTSKEAFHIIDTYKLFDSRQTGDQLELELNLPPSYIVWGADIFDSFQAGYLKPLDYDLCMSLRNSTAKRLYRFLDKRFYQKSEWIFELKELAHMHVGLGRNYEGPAHLKRSLQPAITELEEVGFLAVLSESERFIREGKNWKVRFVQRPLTLALSAELNDADQAAQVESSIADELEARGVTAKTVAELVGAYPSETLHRQIDVFDWLVEKQDKRVAKSPAGYLVKSITDGYKPPKGYVSKEARERAAEATRLRHQTDAEESRRKQEAEAEERRKREQAFAYWEALTPEQQAELQAKADAEAGPDERAMLTGSFKKHGQLALRMTYIRRLLDEQKAAQVGE